MNTSTHRPSKIGGLVLLLAVGGSAFYALRSLAGAFASLDARVGLVTTVAALVVLLSATAISRAIKHASRTESVHPMNGERGALYSRMLKVWAVLIAEDGSLADETVKGLATELAALESVLVLIASPEVLKAYLTFRSVQRESLERGGDCRAPFGSLMAAMRRDLAPNAPDMEERDLLAVLSSITNLPANRVDQEVDSGLARSPEHLTPHIFLEPVVEKAV